MEEHVICTFLAINLENFGVGAVMGPVDYYILMNRLSEWGGLCSTQLSWFKYYFLNRDYYVIW